MINLGLVLRSKQEFLVNGKPAHIQLKPFEMLKHSEDPTCELSIDHLHDCDILHKSFMV